MSYVVDAHAFGAYLFDRLPPKAEEIFREAERGEVEIALPAIVVAELIHVLEKAKLDSFIWEIFESIDEYPSFMIQPLDESVLKLVPGVRLQELHDRIVVATCKHLSSKAVITKDREIRTSNLVETVY
jgi:predicted nucleic acid-binding protein